MADIVVTKDTTIEELVESVPGAVKYLMEQGIRCIICGEPIWGTLEEAAEEKDSFTVELKSVGDSKIGVIKAVKAVLGLGLSEAKELVEGAPKPVKEGIPKEEAEKLKEEIEGAGGSCEIK